MFVATIRGTQKVVEQFRDVEEAMLAEELGLTVKGTSKASIEELAAYRCETSPDFSSLPNSDDEWVHFTSSSGQRMICRVLRLFRPDDDGFPTMVELMSMGRTDSSFVTGADKVKPIDMGSLSPGLRKALIEGTAFDEDTLAKPRAKILARLRRPE